MKILSANVSVDTTTVLGEGASGIVYKGIIESLFSRKTVAVKVFDFSSYTSKLSFEIEKSAHHTVKKLGSRYFAKTYAIHNKRDKAQVVMKLYEQDLFEYALHWGEFEELMRPIFRRIFEGVKKLHENQIAHLDLKPENILMHGTKPYITDFGAHIQLSKNQLVHTKHFHGTFMYAGPEMNNQYFDPLMADIYSLGVMMHVCLTRTFPFLTGTRMVDLSYAHSVLSPEAADLISLLLAPIPSDRPSIQMVIHHPWCQQ
jgi:serine/threonine protein kinase